MTSLVRALFVASLPALTITASCSSSDATSGAGGATTATSSSTTSTASVSSSSTSTSTSTASSSSSGGGGPVGTPYAFVGASDAIRVMKLDTTSGDLTLVQSIDGGPNPSFLVVSPDHRFLYSADEGSSEIAAFAIDPKTAMLTPLNRASAVGQGPAHVAIDATGKLVFGVNYGSGDVTMLPVNADGSLGMSLTNFATGANAHQLVIDSMNHFAFVPNKGSDSVSLLVLDANAKTLTKKGDAATFKQGSGPRHIALDPKGPFAFVMHELSSEIAALKLDPATGAMTLLATMSSLPMGFSGNNTGAEIAFGHDAKFLYASNRGHDSIAIVSVDHATGAMTLVGHQPTGGSTPRHFSIEPAGNVMLVGNQGSNSITTFRIEADGKLTPLATTTLPSGPEFVGVSYF